ncbi:MAG: MBL fold metallo-hydrolase [Cyclobacteriaceae bacterium]
MSLYVASLNSGSNGNCYYVGTDQAAILIDAGISCRETERRMRRLKLSMETIKAVFITHEHADHIYGVARIAKKYRLPIFITPDTLRYANLSLPEEQVHPFRAHVSISIGPLTVTPIPKYHDAVDPHSFIISNETVKVGVFTDVGVPCENTLKYFGQCHAAFLETNYDEEMLERGTYPMALKQRIRGGQGHLSNKQALQLFVDYRPLFMTHLFLSHLSRNNNSPRIVEELFAVAAGGTQIVHAPRYRETKLFQIRDLGNVNERRTQNARPFHYQLNLFK